VLKEKKTKTKNLSTENYISGKTVLQNCPAKPSCKTVLQNRPAKLSCKTEGESKILPGNEKHREFVRSKHALQKCQKVT
jgi:hypothetical protein